MKITLLRIDSMGGGKDLFTEIAYLDRETAEVVAKQKNEEWTSYIPEDFNGEEIANDRIIVSLPNISGPRVFRLNRTEGAQAVLEGALKKLTDREREVLGLKL